MSILAIVVVCVLIFVVFPRTGAYNAGWGYGPSIGGIVLLLFVLWLFFGGGLARLH